MPRKRVRRLWPIVLTPTELAEAMGCPLRMIERAIKAGELRAYKEKTNRRGILVADAVEWYRASRQAIN